MLSTGTVQILCAAAVIIAVLAAICAALAARRAQIAQDYAAGMSEWVSNTSPKAIALKQLAAIEVELTDHEDTINEMYKGLKSLRSRVGMRELRDKRKVEGSDLPDPSTDPIGWKKAMRQKLHAGKLNGQ